MMAVRTSVFGKVPNSITDPATSASGSSSGSAIANMPCQLGSAPFAPWNADSLLVTASRPHHFAACSMATDSAGCRSEEHTSELQSLMRISYAVFCLKKKKQKDTQQHKTNVSES